MDKTWLSAIATAISLIAFLPYLVSTLRGAIRPHVAIIAFMVALLAYSKRGDIHIMRSDWVFFLTALAAIPLWYLTDSALLAVLLVTTIDVLGFGPTLRKGYAQPQSESLLFFSMIVVRNILVVLALESYSVTTALFPFAIGSMAAVVFTVVLTRRIQLKPKPGIDPH